MSEKKLMADYPYRMIGVHPRSEDLRGLITKYLSVAI